MANIIDSVQIITETSVVKAYRVVWERSTLPELITTFHKHDHEYPEGQ